MKRVMTLFAELKRDLEVLAKNISDLRVSL